MTTFDGIAESDQDAVRAAADLADRAGATSFDIGYDIDPPHHWHAQAYYHGMKLSVSRQPSAEAAATSLSTRLLTGAACRCGQKVTLRAGGRGCLWRLDGPRWVPGCDAPSMDLPVAQRGKVGAMRRAVNERSVQRKRRAS